MSRFSYHFIGNIEDSVQSAKSRMCKILQDKPLTFLNKYIEKEAGRKESRRERQHERERE